MVNNQETAVGDFTKTIIAICPVGYPAGIERMQPGILFLYLVMASRSKICVT